MSYLRDRVIVLHKEPFREQDRRYVMYGREHGILFAVARGSAVRTSKQAGHLEPFSESEVMIAKGVAFDKLAVARMVHAPRQTRLASLTIYGAVAHMVMRLVRPGMADEQIFFLLQEVIRALEELPREPTPERSRLMLAAATLRLLDVLGFAPPIERATGETTPVPGLVLVAFMRRASIREILRITASTELFASASAFVEEAVRATPLESEPHGVRTIQSVLR